MQSRVNLYCTLNRLTSISNLAEYLYYPSVTPSLDPRMTRHFIVHYIIYTCTIVEDDYPTVSLSCREANDTYTIAVTDRILELTSRIHLTTCRHSIAVSSALNVIHTNQPRLLHVYHIIIHTVQIDSMT